MSSQGVYYQRAPLRRDPGSKLRLLLIRNGESCDRLKREWYKHACEAGNFQFVNVNQPTRLPRRTAIDEFERDPPVTNAGFFCLQLIGRHLRRTSVKIRGVYSSPSLRCIQSAASLLDAYTGQKGNNNKIMVEPGFFEPLNFYKSQQMPPFMNMDDLNNNGFPVDMTYDPMMSLDDLKGYIDVEKAPDFYNRIGHVTRAILETLSEDEEGTLLVVSHAPVLDAVVRYMLHLHCPNVLSDLIRMGVHYPFACTVAVEREAGKAEVVQGSTWTLNPYLVPTINMAQGSCHVSIPEFKPKKPAK